MSNKKRYFIIVSHCLLNPATRVHALGRRFEMAEKICDYFLSRKISIIQLPCPEFTAMGYMRNPQGRQQYNNVFFKKHCREELENYVDMIEELINNKNTLLCFIGIGGSPTCSINWGKHKINKYKTESIMPIEEAQHAEDYCETFCCDVVPNQGKKVLEQKEDMGKIKSSYGVMTAVLDEMLKERGIVIPYLEAPVKEDIASEKVKSFMDSLDDLFESHRDK